MRPPARTEPARTDTAITAASAAVAVLAIAASVTHAGQPVQFGAVLGAVLLGPGALACRLAAGSAWTQCLTVGLALNIAALMVLSLAAVALRFWHPEIELAIPGATCVLGAVLLRRGAGGDRASVHSHVTEPSGKAGERHA